MSCVNKLIKYKTLIYSLKNRVHERKSGGKDGEVGTEMGRG